MGCPPREKEIAACSQPWLYRCCAGAWALLALTLAARVGVGLAASSAVLHDRQTLNNIFLLPIRDLIALLVWVASFAGHQVHWRGDVFYLQHGRLARASREVRGAGDLR